MSDETRTVTERDVQSAIDASKGDKLAFALWAEFGWGDPEDRQRPRPLAPTDPYWTDAAARLRDRFPTLAALPPAALRGTAAQADGPRFRFRFDVSTYDDRRREVAEMIDEADRQNDTPMGPDGLADALMEIAEGWVCAAQADTAPVSVPEPEYDPQDNRWDLAAKAQRDGDHAAAPFTVRRETPRERAARERQGGGS